MSLEQQNAAMLENMDALLAAIEQRTLNANAIYVASTGSDNNPGTEDNPVQTFCKAVTLLQQSAFNVIYLRSTESFNTITGRGSRRAFDFESGTTILLDTWGYTDKTDLTQRADLTVSTELFGGLNATALELRHIGSMHFGSRYINFNFEAPDATVGVDEAKIALIRTSAFTQGGSLDLHIHQSDLTTTTEGPYVATLLYATILDMSVRQCDLHGPQSLIRNADSSCSRVAFALTTADVGSVVLDGGTLGENVMTNATTIAL